MTAIEVSSLTKIYKGKKGVKVEALSDVSLSVRRGEIFGFLGPNGAGKSTTIKTLMGLITPTSGVARINGVDVMSPEARQKVGYLPENPAFYDYLSAEEYLAFVGQNFGMPTQQVVDASEKVLRLLSLWDARKRPIRSYSKGMVQRLGLAQVLLHDPDVYILDEPMSGLDPIGRALVKDIILDLKARGKCVFFSTHIIADVETVCDRVGIIIKGRLQRVEEVLSVLVQGITGYRVRFAADVAGSREISVAKENLQPLLAEAAADGKTIVLIEPERKSLEELFLDMVKEQLC